MRLCDDHQIAYESPTCPACTRRERVLELGAKIEQYEKVTADNYEDGELMKCTRCGEQWNFAAGAVEYDRHERQYSNPVSPCCRCEMVREVKA